MEAVTIAGQTIFTHGPQNAQLWVMQLSGAHEQPQLDAEAAALDHLTQGTPYRLLVVPVDNWNADLSPWDAPPVFGNEPFAGHAADTLRRITASLIPALNAPENARWIIAGYSLAGLFALWAACETDHFAGVAAASPSVWYPHWLEHAAAHPMRAQAVQLSLGDKEARTRHPLMSTVADCITAQRDLLVAQGVPTELTWNPGNHFREPEQRLARAIAQVIAALT